MKRMYRMIALVCCAVFLTACGAEVALAQNQPLSERTKAYLQSTPILAKDLPDGREKAWLHFADCYSICASDLNFKSPSDLSDAEKYLFFRFTQDYFFNLQGETAAPDRFETIYYSQAEDAVVLPMSVVREWLAVTLGTDAFDPKKAFAKDDYPPTRDGKRPYGYYPVEDVYITPMLSGFGGVRMDAVLDFQEDNGILTITVGFYHWDEMTEQPSDLYEWVEMQVKKSPADPAKYTVLNRITTVLNKDGTQSVLDHPQADT